MVSAIWGHVTPPKEMLQHAIEALAGPTNRAAMELRCGRRKADVATCDDDYASSIGNDSFWFGRPKRRQTLMLRGGPSDYDRASTAEWAYFHVCSLLS